MDGQVSECEATAHLRFGQRISENHSGRGDFDPRGFEFVGVLS